MPRVDVENLSLRQISDELLPRDAAQIQAVAAEALSRGQRALHITEDFAREHYKDEAALSQLYEVVDRLRIAAKDVQNYIDRSLLLTHGFVPIIESTYPCHGGNKAVSLAHSLHLGLGRVKEAVGGGGAVGAGHVVPTSGAADLLADTERALGSVIGQTPDGLQPMLEEKDSQEEENVVMAAISEPMIYPLPASCRTWRCQRQGLRCFL
mmetsp:Transcript_78359/g.123419  ORF Transcript_78359/g.123419 Transcript_78359/m.123419 type:complete len:209 (-) Transcript_78359:49-675(-)